MPRPPSAASKLWSQRYEEHNTTKLFDMKIKNEYTGYVAQPNAGDESVLQPSCAVFGASAHATATHAGSPWEANAPTRYTVRYTSPRTQR